MRLLLLVEILLALFVAVIVYCFVSFPNVGELNRSFPHFVYQGKGKDPLMKIEAKRPANWVNLNEISKSAVGAIIVSEDWAFYTHEGYDLNQIKESMEKNIRLHRFARGGSTITQQVARNVYLSQEKTITRKLRELLIAIALEKSLKKHKILEIYLNIAELGEGIYGIRDAAQFYFKKPPSQLTASEGAFLAMLLPSPKKYAVSFRKQELTPYARGTTNAILRKMVMAGYLAPELLDGVLAEHLSFERVASDAVSAAPPLEDKASSDPIEDESIDDEESQ